MLTACWRHVVDVEPISVPEPVAMEVVGPGYGRACEFRVLGLFPVGDNHATLALRRAEAGAAGLVELVVEETLLLTPVGSWACVEVTGSRFVERALPRQAPPPRAEPSPSPRLSQPATLGVDWGGEWHAPGADKGCSDSKDIYSPHGRLCTTKDTAVLTFAQADCVGLAGWRVAVGSALDVLGVGESAQRSAMLISGTHEGPAGVVTVQVSRAGGQPIECVLTLEGS